MDSFNLKKLNLKDSIIFCLFLILCLFLPFQFALNPASGIDLAVIRIAIPLLFLGLTITTIRKGTPMIKSSPIVCLFILYLFLAAFSISFSNNFFWSLRKLLFLFSIAPIFFVSISILKTSQKKYAAVFFLFFGTTMLALVAIMQFASQFIFGIDNIYAFFAAHISPFFLGHSFSQAILTYPSWLVSANGITYMRAIAVFPDPHMLSYYFGVLIPWSIALWATAKKHKSWLAIATVLIIIADILTFTRGGYVALIAGGIATLPLVSWNTAKKILLGSLLFICLFLTMPHNPVGGRFVSSFDIQEGSNKARIFNWQQALSMISAHPFGVGIGNYSLEIKPTANYREPIYAHNMYLDIAAELGIPAMLVFIAIIILTLKNFWLASKTNPFYIAGIASIVIFAFHSLVESPIYSVHVFSLFLIIIALSLNKSQEYA